MMVMHVIGFEEQLGPRLPRREVFRLHICCWLLLVSTRGIFTTFDFEQRLVNGCVCGSLHSIMESVLFRLLHNGRRSFLDSCCPDEPCTYTAFDNFRGLKGMGDLIGQWDFVLFFVEHFVILHIFAAKVEAYCGHIMDIT